MKYHLIVTAPFGDYQRGDRITDAKAIEKALAENTNEVVKVAAAAK